MKSTVWLFAGILCSAVSLFAQDQSKNQEMTGTICNSSCVVKQANVSTCDTTCTDKSGEAVLVDDQGKVMKLANQDMAMPHMGKHVRIMVLPTEKEREESLRIMQLYEQGP
jgi:hypothetical protein